ncbi:MAG: hypothetical protein RR741_00150 [Erysipelotrichaceae bacterium]
MFILSFFLFLSRRWYIFWIISFFTSYFAINLLKYAIRKDKETMYIFFKTFIIFSLICALILSAILLPQILHILNYNYSSNYSYYLSGGFFGEFIAQFKQLGILLTSLIFSGFILGLINKKTRSFALIMFSSFILTIFTFTHIQNMSYHHMLILFPFYSSSIIFIFINIIESRKKYIAIFISILIISNSFISYNLPETENIRFFSNLKLKTPERKDLDMILEIDKWIISITQEKNNVYIIPHGSLYNPDVFRNADQENMQLLRKIIPFGSAVLGLHEFPRQLLTSQFVVTITPFKDETCGISLASKYNDAFLSLVNEHIFEMIQSFHLQDNYTLLVYKRIKPLNIHEVEFYELYFKDEIEQFPELFIPILNEFK